MRGIILLSLGSFILPAFCLGAAKVTATTGGLLIPNSKGTFYLESRQATEIEYSNNLLGKDATVEIEYGMRAMLIDAKGNREDADWDSPTTAVMKPAGKGKWKIRLDQMRHGLGGTRKAHGINFVFKIGYPGEEAVLDTCQEGKTYSIDFQYTYKLNWRKLPDQQPVLEKVTVDCQWNDGRFPDGQNS